MLLCVLDSVVTRWRPLADWPSIGAFLAASSDCPCDNYCRVWVQCELLSRARVRLAFMSDIVWSLGAAIIAGSSIPRSISRCHVIDMNPVTVSLHGFAIRYSGHFIFWVLTLKPLQLLPLLTDFTENLQFACSSMFHCLCKILLKSYIVCLHYEKIHRGLLFFRTQCRMNLGSSYDRRLMSSNLVLFSWVTSKN